MGRLCNLFFQATIWSVILLKVCLQLWNWKSRHNHSLTSMGSWWQCTDPQQWPTNWRWSSAWGPARSRRWRGIHENDCKSLCWWWRRTEWPGVPLQCPPRPVTPRRSWWCSGDCCWGRRPSTLERSLPRPKPQSAAQEQCRREKTWYHQPVWKDILKDTHSCAPDNCSVALAMGVRMSQSDHCSNQISLFFKGKRR